MLPPAQNKSPAFAGFWIRLVATLLDLTFVTLLVMSLRTILIGWNVYLPVELTILLSWPVYAVAAQSWKGKTLGKWLCGLTVVGRDGSAMLGGPRMVLREVLAKPSAMLPLGGGLIGCVFSRQKRGLHDWLAGSLVTRGSTPLRGWGRPIAYLLVMVVLVIALDVPGLISIGQDYLAMRSTSPSPWPFEQRDPKELIEAASVDEARLNAWAQWVGENALSPVDYAVARARQHPVLIVGEGAHERKQVLEYFNALIPELYRRAGVTRVAMEVCLARDNDRLRQLVTADVFDAQAALELARHQPWGLWGFKEYWDVFETVWRLNQTIPDGQEKVLVIGLDEPGDMPSMGMLGGDNDWARNCPAWEKLRIVRIARVMPKLLARDVRMARQIELEILDKGKRGVVLVGGAHAMLSPQQITRMAVLLRRKHGDRVFCIRIHSFDLPASIVDRRYQGSQPVIGSKIEQMMRRSGRTQAGFDTGASPFGCLRDAASLDYHGEPRVGLQDTADGYVYLRPWAELTQCSWLAGYISPAMFAANKPLYQALTRQAGVAARNADDVNRIFEQNP